YGLRAGADGGHADVDAGRPAQGHARLRAGRRDGLAGQTPHRPARGPRHRTRRRQSGNRPDGGVNDMAIKPMSLVFSAIGGALAGMIYKRLWKAVSGEDQAPTATDT